MSKSRDAFRTISEVAEWMETPAHVLRFWESKFSQVKPVKRAGGRRYYRPADMELLGGIKKLLHDEGMTIKGVQKVLRDQGIAHVAGLSVPVEDPGIIADAPFIDAPEATDTVVPFQMPEAETPPVADPPQPAPDAPETPDPSTLDLATTEAQLPEIAPDAPDVDHAEDPVGPTSERLEDTQPELGLEPPVADAAEAPAPADTLADDTFADDNSDAPDPTQSFPQDPADSPMPSFLRQPLAPATETEPSDTHATEAREPDAAKVEAPQTDAMEQSASTAEPELAKTGDPKPVPPTIPPDPDPSAITVSPGALSALSGISYLTAADAEALRPVVERLRALQEKLGPQRRS